MLRQPEIPDITQEIVVAYFDLEFCNDSISRHNFPVSIGISYRIGNKEIGNYFSVISFGNAVKLRSEQLYTLGYGYEELEELGSTMDEVTEELITKHEKYQPKMYVSFGKQDEELLKKHLTKTVEHWNFCDALKFLPSYMHIKFDISLEKYAYICDVDFVHAYEPLEDAKTLGDILWCVLQGNADEIRKHEVIEEYDRRLFMTQYKNKKQAYLYLSSLPERTARQDEKMQLHKGFIDKHEERYRSIKKMEKE